MDELAPLYRLFPVWQGHDVAREVPADAINVWLDVTVKRSGWIL
jgi:hypothetical protein